MSRLILASGSKIRTQLLKNAGVPHEISVARIDEEAVKASMQMEGAKARDIADALAEHKARKVALKNQDALVLGCDQVLEFDGTLVSKAKTREEAATQLRALRNKTHQLISAAVIYENAEPVWRRVETVRLRMKDFSESYLESYLDHNWPDVKDCVGCYQLEKEGSRLFSRIEGDYFCVLGMPLLDILSYLALRGAIEG